MNYFGIDWGSSSFRAYRFDERAEFAEMVTYDKGILRVENGDFELVLFDLLGGLLNQGTG